jgi:hypothetical protein
MEYEYVITSAYDGHAPHWVQRYGKAFGAWENFFLFTDWGMANEYRTVTLTTPDGEVSKTFYRDGRIEVSA